MRRIGFIQFILCILLFSGCFSYKEITLIKVDKIIVSEFSKNKIELIASLKLNNPNKYNIKVKSVKLDISLNNKKIGQLHLQNNLNLKRNSTNTYDFKFDSKFEKLDFSTIAVIISAIATKRTNIEVEGIIKGKIGILSRKFPIKFKEAIRL